MALIDIKEVKKPTKHKKLIENSIKAMGKEFNNYIKAKKEVPWWYNERAVIGFYICGLIRNTKNLVLQEFSCEKGKKKGKIRQGRADLWFQYNNKEYIVETKICFTSINTLATFDGAHEWMKEALDQANQYNYNNKEYLVDKANVFALCFETIYCKKKDLDNFMELIQEQWCTEKGIKKLDFYYVFYLEQLLFNKTTYFQYNKKDEFYPALAVYGVFNKSEKTKKVQRRQVLP